MTTDAPRGYWRSRVARRLFGLFLLLTLVPVLLIGGFAYFEVKSRLEDSARSRLVEESKDYGMGLIGRLSERSVKLDLLDTQPGGLSGLDAASMRHFTSVEAIEEGGPVLDARQLAHLARGEAVLLLDAGRPPVLLRALPGGRGLVRAELAADTLWPDDDTVYPYCVLGDDGARLFCSAEAEPLEQSLDALPRGHAGVLEWEAAGEAFMVGYWNALLQSAYAAPAVQVVMFQPREAVLAELNRFSWFFPPMLALAVALSAWLAMRQIRHQMQPLASLVDVANRLAEGDFDAPQALHLKDEFGELARSVHTMSGRLKHKFRLLELLAELDRMILAGATAETLVAHILREAPDAIGCDFVAVMRVRARDTEASWSMAPRLAREAHARPELAVVPGAGLQVALSDPTGVAELADAATVLGPVAGKLAADVRRLWVFSVKTDQRATAAFVAGVRDDPGDDTDLRLAGSGIADRLAVFSSSRAQEEKLFRSTHYDALTQLPNRVLLRGQVERAIEVAARKGEQLAVVLLDLDRFKEINESMGHSFGDRLLVEVAGRLSELAGDDVVARLGGDEFVLLLPGLPLASATLQATQRAEQVLTALASEASLGGRSVSIGGSMGIALYPDNGATLDDLLKSADTALYAAKEAGRAGYRFCSRELDERVQRRFNLIQQLRGALDRDEFELYYQPKVALRSGAIVGAEALLRWRPAGGRMIPPGEFIDLVEEMRMSPRVGEWVLQTACAQLAAWDREGQPGLSVAVNVFPSQFVEPGFAASVSRALAQADLEPARLELEILEQTALDESAGTRETLLGLRRQGIHIALDDFGTGFSSLSYLTRIPANVLKLDRSFISTMAGDRRQEAIIGSIINLAHRVGMTVVAEGVEVDRERHLLEEMGCDLVQGYFFSKPVPADEFVELLRQQARVVA